MAKRTYVRRRRERVADEFDGVRAIRGVLPSSARVVDLGEAHAERWQPFQRAGWRPVDSASIAKAEPGAARVLVDQGGQIVLFQGVLTVRFHPGVNGPRVRDLLGEVGGEIIETLPVADNTFRVRLVGESREPFEAASALANMPECDFAEPELIEPITHRG